jgi:hypothetical protein
VENLSPIIFDDLAPIEIPVTMGKKQYILREASEAVAAKWRNHNMQGIRVVGGKVAGMDGVGDTQALLVSLCLCETDENGAVLTIKVGNEEIPKTVPLAEVRRWHSRIVGPLFDRAKAISKLDEQETEETLVEKIGRLQEQLTEMRERKVALSIANGRNASPSTSEGNSSSATTGTSA